MLSIIVLKTLKAAGIPVDGVSIGLADDITTWVAQPDLPEARTIIAIKTVAQWQRETDMMALRVQRNAKLSASDWTQLADVSAQTRVAWTAYRQSLRDLPATVVDPANPVWPDPPDMTAAVS